MQVLIFGLRIVFDRYQRLALWSGAALWMLALGAAQRRNWQDDWILDGILLPFVVFVAIAALVLLLEDRMHVLAIVAALSCAVVLMIPAVKYAQPYGTTIDAVTHYWTLRDLVQTGHLPKLETYTAIAGMHAWLAGIALTSGFSAEQLLAYVLPLTSALMPLAIYFVLKRAFVPASLMKPAVMLSCLSIFPGFWPFGAAFALAPLLLVLIMVMLRTFYSTTDQEKVAYTLLALLGILQLVVWHSTSPFMLAAALGAVASSPWLLSTMFSRRQRWQMTGEILAFAVFAAFATVVYHLLIGDQVWESIVWMITFALSTNREITPIVPQRMFEISVGDKLIVAFVMHGRDILLFGCAAAGTVVIACYRRQWKRQLPMYVFFLIVGIVFAAAMVLAIADIGYQRFMLVPVAIAPLYAAPLFWWLTNQLPLWQRPLHSMSKPIVTALALLLVYAWAIQVFACQPLVPKAQSLVTGAKSDPLLWLHEANSAYQQTMLNFVVTHASPTAPIAADSVTARQFMRYFALHSTEPHGFYYLARQNEWLPKQNVELLLLHWPGAAAGYNEQVELRSIQAIAAWREKDELDLIYDNGASFVLRFNQ